MNELQKTRTLRMLCVLFAAVILICAVLSPQANAASSASNYENAVLYWTNVERSRHGLSKLDHHNRHAVTGLRHRRCHLQKL